MFWLDTRLDQVNGGRGRNVLTIIWSEVPYIWYKGNNGDKIWPIKVK